jgi:hypothetical protein
MKILLITLALVAGCHTGDLGENCNKDGTCNGTNLTCSAWSGVCAKKTDPAPPSRCNYESECFCVTCAERCGASGVKSCAFSDVSVWGAKPSVCECK